MKGWGKAWGPLLRILSPGSAGQLDQEKPGAAAGDGMEQGEVRCAVPIDSGKNEWILVGCNARKIDKYFFSFYFSILKELLSIYPCMTMWIFKNFNKNILSVKMTIRVIFLPVFYSQLVFS